MKFETNMLHDIPSDNVLAVSLQDSFTEAIRSLAEQFRTALCEITGKITVVVRQAFSKSQNADTVPSAIEEQAVQPEAESKIEPAPEDDDRFIIRDIYSVFVSNTGIQGYENYVMIIPADELDFQIPLTYETEQKNREQEHDFLSEKAIPTEFKKKQAEYDDF